MGLELEHRLGDLLEEVVINGRRNTDQYLSNLMDLIQCITEMSYYFEGRLLRFTQGVNDVAMGRPKKIINIAMVSRLNIEDNETIIIMHTYYFVFMSIIP